MWCVISNINGIGVPDRCIGEYETYDDAVLSLLHHSEVYPGAWAYVIFLES